MHSGMHMSMAMTMDQFGLFGEILFLIERFIESGFDEKAVYNDPVSKDSLSGEMIFYKSDGYWYLRYESLPGNLAVRAIGFDDKQLYLETGTWVDEGLKQVLDAENLRYCPLREGGAEIKNASGQTMLHSAKSVIPKIGEAMLHPRMLCTAPFGQLDRDNRQEIIAFLDKLFDAGAWSNPDPEASGAEMGNVPVDQKQVQLMSMNLIQALEMEQRPMLRLVRLRKMRLTQQQNLAMLFVNQNQILTAIDQGNEAKLADIIIDCQKRFGTRGTDNLTIFVRAGMYKKQYPKLDWPAARRYARADFYRHVRSR